MAKAGDRIIMLGKKKRAAPNERRGVIERILSEDPPRYEVRWDDRRITVLAPIPGAVRIEPVRARAGAAKATAAAKAPAKAAAKKPAAAKPAAAKAPATRRSTKKS